MIRAYAPAVPAVLIAVITGAYILTRPMTATVAVTATAALLITAAVAWMSAVDHKRRQQWAAEDLARDLRAEALDRENEIVAASREQYRETGEHTPEARAILDRRDAEWVAQREHARQARRERLAKAGINS